MGDGASKRVGDLAKGDTVQTPAGLEEIIGFIHNSDQRARQFLAIKHDHGEFNVSSGHMIFLSNGDSVLAGDLEVGSVLSSPAGASSIQSIDVVTVADFKAPLTKSGMITVGGVHASAYSDVDHGVAHFGMLPMRLGEALRSATGVSGAPAARIPVGMVSD